MAKKNIIIFDSLVADVRSIIEEGRQFVRHFFGNVLGNLLYLLIVLQEASRNVERNVGTVDDAV